MKAFSLTCTPCLHAASSQPVEAAAPANSNCSGMSQGAPNLHILREPLVLGLLHHAHQVDELQAHHDEVLFAAAPAVRGVVSIFATRVAGAGAPSHLVRKRGE
jgi:hypothetical protein